METERLMIRNFQMSDVEGCFENWGQDQSLGKYLVMFPMQSIEEMQNLISSFVGNPNVWVLEEKISHRPIGYLTLHIPNEFLEIGELGYTIGENFWHKGYATEAVSAILRYSFEERNLYMVEAKYNEENVPSGKLLQRLGFKTDGVLRDRRIERDTGERRNLVVCSITREEFGE